MDIVSQVFIVDNELGLTHHGVKGMKWGVRKQREQSPQDRDPSPLSKMKTAHQRSMRKRAGKKHSQLRNLGMGWVRGIGINMSKKLVSSMVPNDNGKMFVTGIAATASIGNVVYTGKSTYDVRQINKAKKAKKAKETT